MVELCAQAGPRQDEMLGYCKGWVEVCQGESGKFCGLRFGTGRMGGGAGTAGEGAHKGASWGAGGRASSTGALWDKEL